MSKPKELKEFEAHCTVTIVVEAYNEEEAREEIQEKLDDIGLYGEIADLDFDEDDD